MKSTFFLATFLFLFTQKITAQHFCADRTVTELERERGIELNQQTQNNRVIKTSENTLEIPVAFDVIHHDSSSIGEDGNHTDSTIFATLDSVNNIYAHTSRAEYSNPYSGIDIGIKLTIAKEDPIRGSTPLVSFVI